MKIFDHFLHINLTNDQRNALEMLNAFLESDERVFILQGYAGSGKTTLLKGFVEYLESLPNAGTAVLIGDYPIEIIHVKDKRVKMARIFPRLHDKELFHQ